MKYLWPLASALTVPALVQAAPSAASLAEAAARRFPQPVRVGDLLGRAVLQPTESQTPLGRVRGVVRGADGALRMVMTNGGLLGVGGRLIAVPIDAVVLVGDVTEVVGLTPAELRALPTYDRRDSPLGPEEVIRVGLAKPSH